MSSHPSSVDALRNSRLLFARASRNSGRAIVAISDSALANDTTIPAFYCVHDITGGALSDLTDLAQRLNTTVRFYGIQAPPRKIRDAEFGGSIQTMAQYYADVLRSFQQNGPYLLGGYCAGAIIALEIAQQLRAGGRDVSLLIAIDAVPENTPADLQAWHPAYLLEVVRNLPGWLVNGGLAREKNSHSLWRRFTTNVIALGKAAMGRHRAQKLTGGYAIDGLMNLARYSPEERAFINRFYAACFAYFPQSYSGTVVVYEAKVKPLFVMPQLHSRWRRLAPHAATVPIPGTHLSLLRPPHVDEFARDLGTRITGSYSLPAATLREDVGDDAACNGVPEVI